jgi:hypothetical protein
VLSVTETIRSGVPQRGMDYAGMPAEARDAFYRGTFTECIAAGRQLAASEDFSACRSLIDIGGGSGEAYPVDSGPARCSVRSWAGLKLRRFGARNGGARTHAGGVPARIS